MPNLIRFAHNWNVGILECWNIGFWPTARRGNCDVGAMEKLIVDMGKKDSNNKNIPLKTTFHHSTIPLFPGPDRN